MKRILLIFAFSVFLISCGKEETQKQRSDIQKNETQESNEDNSDTSMTAEELFSFALIQNIMGEEEDIELQDYLEEQIYPLVSGSDKVTIDRISSSLYLLSYNDGGNAKNLLIQKFYNPAKDEFVFDKKDIELNSIRQFVK